METILFNFFWACSWVRNASSCLLAFGPVYIDVGDEKPNLHHCCCLSAFFYTSLCQYEEWPEAEACASRCTADWFHICPPTQIVHDQIISFTQFTCVCPKCSCLTIYNPPTTHLFCLLSPYLSSVVVVFFNNDSSWCHLALGKHGCTEWCQQEFCRVAEDRGGVSVRLNSLAPAFLIKWPCWL